MSSASGERKSRSFKHRRKEMKQRVAIRQRTPKVCKMKIGRLPNRSGSNACAPPQMKIYSRSNNSKIVKMSYSVCVNGNKS